MSGLERRVDALEQLAEEARRCELRGLVARLAAERGLSAATVWEHFERLQAEDARLRAEGLSDDAIMALKADRLGITPDELVRRGEALAGRRS